MELDSKVDRVIYYVEWVEMYLYYSLVRDTMVEATLLWASVEKDMLDKKVILKFFPWWNVAHAVLKAQCFYDMSAEIGGTPATASVIGGETSQWRWAMQCGQVLAWKFGII